MMGVKMNTTTNYKNVWPQVHKPLPSTETLIARNAKEVWEIS